MMIHPELGCTGAPVLKPRFIEIESMKTPFGYRGAPRVSTNPNPNPTLVLSLFARRGHFVAPFLVPKVVSFKILTILSLTLSQVLEIFVVASQKCLRYLSFYLASHQ